MSKPTNLYKKKNLEKRLAKVERIQKLQRPELKINSGVYGGSLTLTDANIYLDELTGIGTGTDQNDRIGNEITIYDIEIRMFFPNSGIEFFLIQSTGEQIPTYSDFIPTVGGGLQPSFGHGSQFKTLMHYNSYFYGNGKWYRKFKYPLRVKYDGNTAADGSANRLFLVVKNDTNVTVSGIQFACVMRYYDS